MGNTNLMTGILAPFQPQLPLEELVLEVNQLYHAVEARDYDQRHPEVREQLPPLWQEMIDQAHLNRQPEQWRILDFGCGTGFEAEQLIRNLPQGSIGQLICYDASPEMLAQCRANIAPLCPTARFTSNLRAIPTEQPFNLLVTNSLLHHLPDPLATIHGLSSLLDQEAFWLAGHEPSSRFYRNQECQKLYNLFLQERQWRKFLSPERYLQRLRQAFGLESNPANRAAKEAFRKGLFKQKPSALAIGRLVDFHVAHSLEEATSGRGFDIELMQTDFAADWQLVWLKTYSFMGAFYEGSLPKHWQQSCYNLGQRFPKDGANFCTIWRRVAQTA